MRRMGVLGPFDFGVGHNIVPGNPFTSNYTFYFYIIFTSLVIQHTNSIQMCKNSTNYYFENINLASLFVLG